MVGFRGYVSSRPFFGQRAPQRVQNLVIRDYCKGNSLLYLLSAVEYIMHDCYAMLEKVLVELPEIDGIIFYSMFQLPVEKVKRQRIYSNVLKEGRSLHFALETLKIETERDISSIEDIWEVQQAVDYAPCLSDLAALLD
ncbi:MAG: sporadic carbohydrate cluster protein, LIC12192 family [Acidiferrobacteraceae bacterium]|nr:sporadic carbohydrate cluster protein, LIC12192 family [Acidiferrobacteraceae bacterium]|tara:strand:- start:45077 stop:45493 length:417 start_codon:yes stop_codon:yes gene_type:complete